MGSADMVVSGTLLLFIVKSIFASTECNDISKCISSQVLHTLLLGGSTSSSSVSTSIELITPTKTCTAGNELPVGRNYASAAVLGSTIYYCGGFNGNNFETSCNSYDLN